MNNKISVLHVITRFIVGGAQENTLFTVAGLTERGCDVTLVTGPPFGPEGSLMEEAVKMGVCPVVIQELRRQVNPYFDFIAFWKIFRMIKKNKYTIVHTHSSKAGILGRLAAWLAGTPVIIHTIHGLPFDRFQNRFLNRVYILAEKLAAAKTHKLISVSRAMIKAARDANVAPGEKFALIRSGLDLSKFPGCGSGSQLRKRLGIPEGSPVIGNIGRLFPMKGHEYVIEAAPEIVKRFPDVRILFVGDGILRGRLEERVRALGLSRNFVFAGLVPPGKIPDHIHAMDVLVHTSLREGLARALPEAFACSKPAVAFDLNGADEVIEDGRTGYLVKPLDPEGLAGSLIKLLSDPSAARKMGEEGRRRIEAGFSKDLMVDQIHALYESLLR